MSDRSQFCKLLIVLNSIDDCGDISQQTTHPPGRGDASPSRLQHVEVPMRPGDNFKGEPKCS